MCGESAYFHRTSGCVYRGRRYFRGESSYERVISFVNLSVKKVHSMVNQNPYYIWSGILQSLLINFIGTFICFLLVQKQLKIHSSYSDKICSLFKQVDCNSVIESSASSLWNIFNWHAGHDFYKPRPEIIVNRAAIREIFKIG